MNTVDATASGFPYRVVTVGGTPPSDLDQFLGETDFTLDKFGAESIVQGIGAAADGGVRFMEKGGGKDVRCWQIRAGEDGFKAESLANF